MFLSNFRQESNEIQLAKNQLSTANQPRLCRWTQTSLHENHEPSLLILTCWFIHSRFLCMWAACMCVRERLCFIAPCVCMCGVQCVFAQRQCLCKYRHGLCLQVLYVPDPECVSSVGSSPSLSPISPLSPTSSEADLEKVTVCCNTSDAQSHTQKMSKYINLSIKMLFMNRILNEIEVVCYFHHLFVCGSLRTMKRKGKLRHILIICWGAIVFYKG